MVKTRIKKLPIYLCEVCGTPFLTHRGAELCEECHIRHGRGLKGK